MSQESFIVLQRENHSLLRENNALHLEIIRIQEELDTKSKSIQLKERDFEHQIQQLQFLNTQKTAQLQKKDADLSKLYAQVQRLQATKGGNTNESIEMSKNLPKKQDENDRKVPPHAAIPVPSSDISKWDIHQETMQRENTELLSKIAQLEAQVRAREAEIERLGKQLKENLSNKDYATIKAKYDLEAKQQADDLAKEQLTRQVDLLNDQVAKYEKKLQESKPLLLKNTILTEQLSQLRDRSEQYVIELNSLRKQYQQLDQEHSICTTKHVELVQDTDQRQGFIEQLQDELRDSKQHISRLEHALKATHYDKVSSTNSVANLEAHIKMLTTEIEQLKPKYKDANAQAAEMASQNKQLHRQLESLEGDLKAMQMKLGSGLAEQHTTQDTIGALKRECESLENLIQDRDKQLRQSQSALDSAQDTIRAMEQKLNHAQALHAQENQRSSQLQSQHSTLYAEERAALRQDNDALKAQLRQLELQRKDTGNELTACKTQLELTRQQAEEAHSQLSEKLLEMQQLQTQYKQLKLDLIHTQEDKASVDNKLADSHRELEKLMISPPSDSIFKTHEQKWQQRLQEAVVSKQQIETQLTALRTSKESLELRLSKSTNELRKADETAAKLQEQVNELQQQLASTQSELQSTKQSKIYFENEYNHAFKTWVDQTQDFRASQHEFSTIQATKVDQARQIQELQASLLKANTKCHQLEILLEQAQTSRKTLETQWTLTQEELRHTKERQLAREAQLKRLQAETSEQKTLLLQSDKDNEQLKHVVAEMNYARDNWTLEQKQLALELSQLRDAKQFVDAQLEDSQVNERNLKDQLHQMKSVLQAMDREKDQLTDALDRKTEEITALHQQTYSVTQEQTSLRGELQDCQLAFRRLENALQEKETATQTLTAQLAAAETTNRTYKQDIDLLRGEQVALQGDLHHMTVENQSLAGECATLHHELDQVSDDNQALHQHIRQVEREREGCKIELEDLKQTYRALVVEMDALEVTRAQLSSTREDLNTTTMQLRHQVQNLTRERDDAVHHIHDLETEHEVYTQQIKSLTLQLQQLQDKQDAQSRSQEILSGALQSQHQVATELAHERVESAAHNSSLNQRISYLQAQLNNSIHDRTQLTNQVSQLTLEKQRVETLLSTVRSQLATLQVQVHQQQEDKTALVNELAQFQQTSDRASRQSSPQSYIPTMQEAEERCRSLEERLSRQDATIQQLEQSRSKFRKFAAKYESELVQRDRIIDALRSSQQSSHDSVLAQSRGDS